MRPIPSLSPLAVCALCVATACGGCEESGVPALPKTAPAIVATAGELPEDEALKAAIDRALNLTVRRHMNSRDHAAWQIVHGILAFDRDLTIEHDGRLVSALDWLLDGGELNGWRLMPGERGLDALLELGSKTGQGHEDQWLGYLSQVGLPEERPITIHVGDELRTYALHDLVAQAQWDIRDGQEATWTLMGLCTYLSADATWTARDGSQWSLERIAAWESSQDLTESACGGSHRLEGLAMALAAHREQSGLSIDELSGGWQAAYETIRNAAATIRSYQQPDGTFSTEYFRRPATSPAADLRLSTTGHQLEFLAMSLPDDELAEPWVTRSVVQVCRLFEATQDLAIECGGLYHAAHGLKLYRERRFGPWTPPRSLADDAGPTESLEDVPPADDPPAIE